MSDILSIMHRRGWQTILTGNPYYQIIAEKRKLFMARKNRRLLVHAVATDEGWQYAQVQKDSIHQLQAMASEQGGDDFTCVAVLVVNDMFTWLSEESIDSLPVTKEDDIEWVEIPISRFHPLALL